MSKYNNKIWRRLSLCIDNLLRTNNYNYEDNYNNLHNIMEYCRDNKNYLKDLKDNFEIFSADNIRNRNDNDILDFVIRNKNELCIKITEENILKDIEEIIKENLSDLQIFKISPSGILSITNKARKINNLIPGDILKFWYDVRISTTVKQLKEQRKYLKICKAKDMLEKQLIEAKTTIKTTNKRVKI